MAMPCIFLQLQCDEASLSSFPPSQFQGELYNEFSNPWPSPNMKIEDTFEITKTGLHCALHRQETRIRSSTAWLSSWWSAPLVYRASDAYFHVCEYLFTPDHQQGSTTWRINLPPLWQPPLFCFHSNWPMLLRWLLIDFQSCFSTLSPGNLFSTVDQQSGVLLHLHMHWPGMIIGQCMALCVGYFIWLKGHFQDLSRFQLWSAWLRLWWNRRKLGQWLQQWPGGFVKCSSCDWVWPGSTRPRSWGK